MLLATHTLSIAQDLVGQDKILFLLSSRLSRDWENVSNSVRLRNPTATPLKFSINLKCVLVDQYLQVPSRSNYDADDRHFLGDLLQLPVTPDNHEGEEEVVCFLCPEKVLMLLTRASSTILRVTACLHALCKTKQTWFNCFDAVTQSDPLPAVVSLSAMKEVHKESLICVRGYVFGMLVLIVGASLLIIIIYHTHTH